MIFTSVFCLLFTQHLHIHTNGVVVAKNAQIMELFFLCIELWNGNLHLTHLIIHFICTFVFFF